MADKTVSHQPSTPSTPFRESYSIGPNSLISATSTSTSPAFSSPSISTIYSGVNRSKNMEPKTTFDVKSMLLSPPEATPFESFNPESTLSTVPAQMNPLFPIHTARMPLSPPISPATKTIAPEEPSTLVTRDPILYPHSESAGAASSQLPLFGESAAKRVVHNHVAAREPDLFRDASPPRQVEYELALEFKSHIFQTFSKSNKLVYLSRERAQLLEDQAMRSGTRRYPVLAPATGPGRGPRTSNLAKLNRVVKTGKAVRAPRPAVPRATPEPGPKRVAREDKDFHLLRDYSPPTSSLPDKYNSLKVEWRGAPIDVDADPHRHLLHRDELLLAANLRLDCATYLTSKRRIFLARIEALRIKKEFRKTDAQQACKIDVNKASKLWAAYEKVGWLNPKWVERYV